MAAISTTLLQLCSVGDEIVAGRTIYGGTYALLKNLLPRFGITTRFVDVGNPAAVRAAINGDPVAAQARGPTCSSTA